MKEPSDKRRRTLALHDRAIRFSVGVNACCPQVFSNFPSKTVWEQLVRAADSTSNNLIEAEESRAALMKLRLGSLDRYQMTVERNLESEASQLAAIFATIILNMRLRLDEQQRRKSRKP